MELRCVCAARNAWKSALAYEAAAQRRVVAEMLRGDESRVEADGSAVQGGIGSCGHRVVEVAAWPCRVRGGGGAVRVRGSERDY